MQIQQRWLLFTHIASHSVCFFMVFALLFVSYFLSFSCSALLSTSFRSLQYICSLPGFGLCNLDDTIFFWTWLTLSELSYCSLFHEHQPISLLFPSLSSLLLIELFAIVATKIDCNQWLLKMSASKITHRFIHHSFINWPYSLTCLAVSWKTEWETLMNWRPQREQEVDKNKKGKSHIPWFMLPFFWFSFK